MKIKMDKVTDEDAVIIKKQLRTSSLFICGVAKRCPYGFPQIAVLNPVFEDEQKTINYSALKNPLWLTCPHLNKGIHKIEDNMAVSKIQKFIRSDRFFKTKMEDAHAHYYYFRKELFSEISGRSFEEDLVSVFNSGIGGIADVTAVKCLHMHFAHYQFCTDNIAGKITDMILDGDTYCSGEKCKWLK